jgi:4-hydroxybenzoate polyprenyltransferase
MSQVVSNPSPEPSTQKPVPKGLVAKLRAYSELVAFSHTVFALPFAATATLLALREPHVPLTPLRVAAMLVCMVTARTSAMAFNRYADRDVDAKNPRTRERPIQSGRVKPREALALTVGSGLVFVGSASSLGWLTGVLAVPVLAVLLGYSLAKRFTWGAHAWLGLALSLAPGGAWIAVGATPGLGIVALMVGVVTWLFGFDVLYSLQDERFDRENGLHSVPSRFGTQGALRLSAFSHVLTVASFVSAGLLLHRGVAFFVGTALFATILFVEHRLVRGGNLEKIDKAFFDCNAFVSLGFFVTTAIDAWLLSRG